MLRAVGLIFAGCLIGAVGGAWWMEPGLFERRVSMVDDPCDDAQAPPNRKRYMIYSGYCRYRGDNRELLRSGRRPETVLMGDSLFEHWRIEYPDLFGKDLVNRGISGQTSQQMLLRFESDVVALRPRIVHILAGTNDMVAPAGGTSLDLLEANVRAMADIADANGIAVVLGTLPPSDDARLPPELGTGRWLVRYNRWVRDFARERGYPVADYHGAVTGPDGAMRKDYFVDPLHPGKAGYRAMQPALDDALARARGRLVPAVPR